MTRTHRTTRRKGVSLAELMVVLSAASIILSLTAGLIHRVMHAEMQARSLTAVERTSLRLANAVRRDIHDAVSAVTDASSVANGVFLRLETSGTSRIEYRRDEKTIHRLDLNGEQVIAREQFAFPSDFELQAKSEAAGLVELTLTSPKAARPDDHNHEIRRAKSIATDLQVLAALRRGGL